jgi:hypothetical protein
MKHSIGTIKLAGSRAKVEIGNNSFLVSRKTKKNRKNYCPGELIIGALGS